MNFRTVGIIRKGVRRGESGQAFTELAVSLIAILAAFVGFLLIAALSSDRVSMLIRARADADERGRQNRVDVFASEGDARSIRYWTYGEDGIPFTADDVSVTDPSGNGGVFLNELTYNNQKVSLTNPQTSLPRLKTNEFTALRDDTDFFVNAAGLVTGEAGTGNTLRDHNIDPLKSAIGWLFHVGEIQVRERVYMPAHKDIFTERGD